jgi:hypothetical protein
MGKQISLGTNRSTDGSKYFHAIRNCVEHGWKKLKEELAKKFKGVQFKLSLFVLITNKDIVKAVADLTEVSIDGDIVPLEFFGKDKFDEIFKEDMLKCNLLQF